MPCMMRRITVSDGFFALEALPQRIAVVGRGYIAVEIAGLLNTLGADVTGRAQLTPAAIAAARRLADRLFGGMTERKLDYELIPTVIFSHPPIATVGLTESEAREIHGDAVKIYQSRFTPMYHAFTRHQSKMAMKLVTIGAREKVIGCHVIGPGADEMLQGFAAAISMGATKQDLETPSPSIRQPRKSWSQCAKIHNMDLTETAPRPGFTPRGLATAIALSIGFHLLIIWHWGGWYQIRMGQPFPVLISTAFTCNRNSTKNP